MSEHAAMGANTGRTFLGHPIGLSTLFFTEMWERFSYYGMRALLILFMTDAARGGMGMNAAEAGALYGLYTFGVYALALPGGWIADRLIGSRQAVLYGGVLIALGHFSMAIPSTQSFYLGLLLIVLGTGLLKPNVSAIVGDLYTEADGARRDAGFSIFYMGINIGAFAGPLICSALGENVNWHMGFGAAGVGMTLGLVQYVYGYKHLSNAGELDPEAAQPEVLAKTRKNFFVGMAGVLGITAALVFAARSGMLNMSLVEFAEATGVIVVGLAAVYFAYVLTFVCRNSVERQRIGVCILLFIGAALFWSGFEQAGSSMNLFAQDNTDRTLLGTEVPAGWLQSVNPLFIILLAPVIGSLWVWLDSRSRNPSIPVKFGLGLILLGLGFLVLSWGATYIDGGKVGMQWLVATYFLHTVGELCLSPVGLSSMTKLAPRRLVSQMMGVWFMGAALGNLIAGLVAGYIENLPQSDLYQRVAMFVIIGGFAFLLLSPIIKKMCNGVK